MSEETLKPAINQYGNIDLGKTGCASRQLWASSAELLQARSGVLRREWMGTEFNVRNAGENALVHALTALVLINLLGLVFVVLRAVFD